MQCKITVAFGSFVTELCPFGCFCAHFVYTNLMHGIS